MTNAGAKVALDLHGAGTTLEERYVSKVQGPPSVR